MAKIIIAGDAAVITSEATMEQIKKAEKYAPKYLALLDGSENREVHALLKKLLPDSENTNAADWERLRRNLDLRLPAAPIGTDFDDEVLSADWKDSGL